MSKARARASRIQEGARGLLGDVPVIITCPYTSGAERGNEVGDVTFQDPWSRESVEESPPWRLATGEGLPDTPVREPWRHLVFRPQEDLACARQSNGCPTLPCDPEGDQQHLLLARCQRRPRPSVHPSCTHPASTHHHDITDPLGWSGCPRPRCPHANLRDHNYVTLHASLGLCGPDGIMGPYVRETRGQSQGGRPGGRWEGPRGWAASNPTSRGVPETD